MAKWGEGDSRWKVEDLGTAGRNVNSWHWEEKNALPWSKERLVELLGGVTLVDGKEGVNVTLEKSIDVSGDAVINQRKGKLIPAYELELKVKWKGTDVEGKEGSGEIKLPYISEENHDEDPEVLVTATTEGEAGEKMRNLVVRYGRPIVYKAIAAFIKDLHAGGPVKRGDDSITNGSHDVCEGQPADASKSDMDSSDTAADAGKISQDASESKRSTETRKQSKGPGSITITETFFCSPKDLYECFTETGKIRAYTGSAADVEPREGGKLSMFGGSVEGSYKRLEPHNRLEMDWRFNSWPDGCLSNVVLKFEENERGTTMLTLHQTNIPDQDRYGNHDVLGMTQAGWKQQVLLRIRHVFGFGV